MRISTRVGRNTYLSMGCLGWTLLIFAIIGLVGWLVSAAGHAATRPAPAGYSVRIVPVTQDYIYGCVPAADSMILSAFGIRVSQDTLAVEMNTYVNQGTYGADSGRVVDSYLEPVHLRMAGLQGVPVRRLAAVLAGQFRAGHPVMLTVRGNMLPWRRTAPATVHVVVAAGIRGQLVRLFDPSSAYGGWYVISVGKLYRAVTDTTVLERTS